MEFKAGDKMRAVRTKDFKAQGCEPGNYCFTQAEDRIGIFMTLPCGHNFLPDHKWQLTAKDDDNKISLTPSIQCSPATPKRPVACWHGYLTNGEFITV